MNFPIIFVVGDYYRFDCYLVVFVDDGVLDRITYRVAVPVVVVDCGVGDL